jgi:hypothetical protein
MRTHYLAIVAVALILAGFLVAWGIYRPRPPKAETAVPSVRQSDGSLELERAPSGLKAGAAEGSRPLKPAQVLPKGAKVERIVQVTVDPAGKPSSGRNAGPVPGGRQTPADPAIVRPGSSSGAACPPVTVDLTLVRMKDKSQRVLASSPDGSVVGGIDVPVQAPAPFKVQRWTASALVGYDSHAGRNVFGGEISYAKGPFVVSGGVIGGTAFAGAGIRF